MTRLFPLIFISIFLTGCINPQSNSISAAVYDLNWQSSTADQKTLHFPEKNFNRNILVINVSAPTWLNTTAMQYRLNYHNPSQISTYANSRWLAPPAALLNQQLRNRIVSATDKAILKDSSIAKASYFLHIELEDLAQVFTATDQSHIALNVRASLVDHNTRELLAQESFNIHETAITADSAGAARAAGVATNVLLNHIVDWLSQHLENSYNQ